HGFGSFQRGVHLNAWLQEVGLLTLKGGKRPEDGASLQDVDWERTQVYTLGLGGLYLNRKDREARGIVPADEAPALQESLMQELPRLVDPARGQRPVRSVVAREAIYRGPYAGDSPDLLVNFSAGYRVSWATALGGVPAGQFEDNCKKWSGDHLM